MQFFDSLFHKLPLFFLIDEMVAGNNGKICQRNILFNTFFQHKPLYLTVLCDKTDSVFHCMNRRFDLHFPAINLNPSFFIWKISEYSLHDLRPACAHKTGDSQNFSGFYLKAYVFKNAFFRQSLHLENRISNPAAAFRIALSDLAADH